MSQHNCAENTFCRQYLRITLLETEGKGQIYLL